MKHFLRCFGAILGLLLTGWVQTAVAASVGYQEVTLPPDASSDRTLSMVILYPTLEHGPTSRVSENAAFVGQDVVVNAQAEGLAHPLVLLSHGIGGNWRNQLWLAKALAMQGYMVAALNHAAPSKGSRYPALGGQLWERPHDLSRALDFLTADPQWSASVASNRVAAVGHSLGGWTVLELAGARLDPRRLEQDCRQLSWLASCQEYEKMEAGRDARNRALLSQSLKDPRVRAVVSLDLGLARGFDPASLAAIEIQSLIIAAGPHRKDLPPELESAHLFSQMPQANTQYMTIEDAGHFSFLQRCKLGAAALLEEESPGDGAICEDGGGRERTAIHEQVVTRISAFLQRALLIP